MIRGEGDGNCELTARAVREFAITIDDAAEPAGAQSGAGVHRARTVGDGAAYLKVTAAVLGSEALDAARREVRFYQQLADKVPVRTPLLLGTLDIDLGVAVLLAAAGDQVEAKSWSGTAWWKVGRDLAALHAVQVPLSDWHRPDTLLAAMSDPDPGIVASYWGGILPGLSDLLDSRDALRAELASQPAVLVHGDCHTANIVHDADGLVYCDWQSAGAGRATSDLAMLAVRATPAGAAFPHDAMAAYLEQRAGDVSYLERALVLEELAIFVFQWPPYAAYNSDAANARVHDRTRQLAARWLDMS